MNTVARMVMAIAAVGLLAACGGNAGARAEQRQLTIFAASSLTDSFGVLEKAFEKDHEGVDVVISYGSSTALAEQIVQGAPADVIATADRDSMTAVVDASLTDGAPDGFATNTLVVVTPPENPAGISSLDDLAGTQFVMCDKSAPCGRAAATVFDQAGIRAEPVSYEADVKAVLSKVTLGEADAGLVYVSDAANAKEAVSTVDIPPAVNVVNTYYIAAVQDTDASDLADEWLDLVESQAGLRTLASFGFGTP